MLGIKKDKYKTLQLSISSVVKYKDTSWPQSKPKHINGGFDQQVFVKIFQTFNSKIQI